MRGSKSEKYEMADVVKMKCVNPEVLSYFRQSSFSCCVFTGSYFAVKWKFARNSALLELQKYCFNSSVLSEPGRVSSACESTPERPKS